MTKLTIDADLTPCPQCQQPLLIINGLVQGRVTFTNHPYTLRPQITPHDPKCPTLTLETP